MLASVYHHAHPLLSGPSRTIAYHRVPLGTIRYHRVPAGTIGAIGAIAYHRVPSGTIGYHRVPSGTIGYLAHGLAKHTDSVSTRSAVVDEVEVWIAGILPATPLATMRGASHMRYRCEGCASKHTMQAPRSRVELLSAQSFPVELPGKKRHRFCDVSATAI